MRATSGTARDPDPRDPREPGRSRADGSRPRAPLPDDRALADRCSRLVRFLRELALARTPCVREIERYPTVLWLADLPQHAEVDLGAGPGRTVLRLAPPRADPPPRLPAELAGWVSLTDRDDSRLAAPPLRGHGPRPPSPDPALPPDGEPRAPASAGPDDVPGVPAGPDAPDVLVERDAPDVPASSVPLVVRAYEEWLPAWLEWAEEDRGRAAHRRCYEALHTAHQRLAQEGDRLELVLATGLLSLRTAEGDRIRHPLLTTRAHLDVERADGTIALRLPEDALTCLEDAALLQGSRGYRAGGARAVHERLRSRGTEPLGPGTGRLLAAWLRAALDSPRGYHDRWEPTGRVTTRPVIDLAPAVLLRSRGRGALVEHYDAMLRSLALPGSLPTGMRRLVEPLEPAGPAVQGARQGAGRRARHEGATADRPGPDPLFCLPTNAEQARILQCLHRDSGVVVEGPPGTGKTHTIANLVGALLAQGQRVLVTSQKAQALRVLHEMLPERMRRLCVSLTDTTRHGSPQLAGSVAAMAAERSIHHAPTRAAQIRRVEAARHRALRRRSLLREQLRALRESQTYEHPPVADGYGGTLRRIAERLARRREEDGWLSDLDRTGPPTGAGLPAGERPPAPAGVGDHPPLTVDQALELLDLLREGPQGPGPSGGAGPDGPGERRTGPDRGPALPPPAELEALLAEERRRVAEADACEPPAGAGLRALAPPDLRDLLSALQELDDAVARLPRDPAEWRARAVRDAVGGLDTALWDMLQRHARGVDEAVEALDRVGLHVVELPGDAGPAGGGGDDPLTLQRHALRLVSGSAGRLRRPVPSPATRAARRAVGRCRVDGARVTTPEQVRTLLHHLRAEILAAGLAHRWAQVRAPVPAGWPVQRRVALLADLADQLGGIGRVRRAARGLDELLRDRRVRGIRAGDLLLGDGPEAGGPPDPRATAAGPAGAQVAVGRLAGLQVAVGRRLAAHRATGAVDDLEEDLRRRASGPGADPAVAAAAGAVRDRDGRAYRRLHAEHCDRRRARDRAGRRAHLLGLLEAGHPALAGALRARPADPAWTSRLSRLPRAWAWARAREFFESQREEGLEESLERELGVVDGEIDRLTTELACERAWQHCLERMTARQVAALRSCLAALDARGKGRGRHAARFAAAARDAMHEARGAVPAWIMPLPDVLSTVPAARDSFDVVIVDEASQAGVENLFLLWMAPKVIVVGDDRQCTPSEVALGALDPILSRLDELLGDLPGWLRVAFTPRSSLFSVLRTRFGQVVRLREHFRCMPEIIEWSNRMFYRDEPLVPLRGFGTARLEPLRTVHVPGAYTEGGRSSLRNQVEAEALVEQVLACSRDPAYEGLSFGVIVLQGTAQADLIRNALLRRLPRAEQDGRRLRVGTPPDFQGDERHVVFLSMVIAPGTRTTSLTRLEYQRRFNVAATRARDQVWLFHSVTVDSLSPADLRHSYLSYLLTRPGAGPGPAGPAVLPDVPCEPFDSLFEQRVYLDVVARGYHVVPQVESNGRRIDLVVTGELGRLAVECDGDTWHSTPEQLGADLVRERQLRRAGWEIWRVRASEYAFDPRAALLPLWKLLDRMRIHPYRPGPDPDPAGPRWPGDGSVPRELRAGPSGWSPPSLSTTDGPDDGASGPEPPTGGSGS